MARLIGILRWIALILGLLLAALVALFAIAEGFDPRQSTVTTGLTTVAFVAAVAGMLALWRWGLFHRSTWRPLHRHYFLIATVIVLLTLGVFAFFRQGTGRPYKPSKNSFDGSSEELRETMVVPTLDTPIPANKSAIWCSSFQLAWNRLKTVVAKGVIRLKNAEAASVRLNQAEQSESDLDAPDFYAAAGLVRDGIVQKIQTEMERNFPDVPTPRFDASPEGAVAYAYMRAQVKFSTPFFDNDEGLAFTDSTGAKIGVKSFGIRKNDDYAYRKLREQVKVLYCSEDILGRQRDGGEFIIDPCKHSHPYQIILACIDRKQTLAEAIVEVHKKMAPSDKWPSELHPRDTLLIPGMHWRINHHFKELEGKDKQFQNPALTGLYLDTALQTIEFRLDRSGAELASESKVFVKPAATFFHFNRRFLIVLKKRDKEHPVFVMWVENAELLDK